MTEAYPSNNQKLDRTFQKSDWWDMRLRLGSDKREPSNSQSGTATSVEIATSHSEQQAASVIET